MFSATYTPEPTRQQGPAKGPAAGTKLLYSFILLHFNVTGLGIYNPRDVAGNPWPKWTTTGSQHATGRAGDSGVPIVRPGGHPEGHRLAAWLIANHLALGIQEVIFAGQRWTNQTQAWKHYTGRSDHFDHVHWAQNAEAAGALTLDMLQAIWAQHPAPADPHDPAPIPSEEDPMKILSVTDGPDGGKTFLVGETRRSYVDSPLLLNELVKVYGAPQQVNGAVWAFLTG